MATYFGGSLFYPETSALATLFELGIVRQWNK